MNLFVVSVRDSATQTFNRPFCVVAPGQAMRSFADEVNRPGDNNELNRHPEDFELYQVGQFDDTTGKFTAPSEPILLARAKELVRTEN